MHTAKVLNAWPGHTLLNGSQFSFNTSSCDNPLQPVVVCKSILILRTWNLQSWFVWEVGRALGRHTRTDFYRSAPAVTDCHYALPDRYCSPAVTCSRTSQLAPAVAPPPKLSHVYHRTSGQAMPQGGYSHWLQYAYARTTRVPFWHISVPLRVGFSSNVPLRVGFLTPKSVPERV